MSNIAGQSWDIPELRIHLAHFLDDSQLAVAAAVCKSWHATFTPVLYSQVIWNESKIGKKPSKKVMQDHAAHIRTLDIIGDVTELPFAGTTNLEDLYLSYGSIDPQVWDQFLELIIRNPGLHKVDLDITSDLDPPSDKIIAALSHCQNIRHLTITLLAMEAEVVEQLFDICSRLQELNLDIVNFEGIESMDKWTQFPSLTSLSLVVGGLSCSQQLEIIRRCPQLRTINWTFHCNEFSCEEVCKAFSTCCLNIKELQLLRWNATTQCLIEDAYLSKVIDSCRNLVTFSISEMLFGPLSFQSLRSHFGSLEKITFEHNNFVSGPFCQEIMLSCPLLDTLDIPTIEAGDILGVVQEEDSGESRIDVFSIIHPQDWICLNLTSLTVQFKGLEDKPLEWNRLVLSQLARLEKLVVLNIGPEDPWGEEETDGLDLRLSAGLDILATLKRLETFMFFRLRQKMEERDVRWMIQAWPRLKNVYGELHTKKVRNRRLKTILRSSRISTTNDYSDEEDE
ncbi:hypothetical protein BGX27_009944 [Mortierella sp. AM989]|nr:hypothetical protein BGX27_009944 [Mortierella sp. AM989]